MSSVLKYLTLPGRISYMDEKDYRRSVILKILIIFAGLVHLILIPAFLYIGAFEMALINVFSVLVWGVALHLNTQGKYINVIFLICTEVLIHSVSATAYLGLDAGFQHYLWAVSALAILNTRFNFLYTSLYSFSFILMFALLYLWFDNVIYSYKYSEFLNIMHFANVMIAGVPFILSMAVVRLISVAQEAHLLKLASVDSLTGLYNRRMATEIASKVLQHASRTGEPVSMVLGDIDYFKKINDIFGHAEGDHVLCEVASFFKFQLRESDIISRWGGEEFLIILPGMDGKSACKKIDMIRQAFHQEIHITTDQSYVVRMSFGIVEYQLDLTFHECLKRADDALYLSKQRGRNQVTLSNNPVQS